MVLKCKVISSYSIRKHYDSKRKSSARSDRPNRRQIHLGGEVRGINEKTHQTSTNGASDGDGHDPGKQQEADTLEVDSLQGTVAETDADGGTGDTHGGGDGEGVLGEDEDGEGGAHLHGGTTAGRVVGDLVTHDY